MDIPVSSCYSSSFPGWKTSPGGDYYNAPPSNTHFPKRIESGMGFGLNSRYRTVGSGFPARDAVVFTGIGP
jgi:hypothetical protein